MKTKTVPKNIISKKLFAEKCGLSQGNLSNYIKRGTVTAGAKGIDLNLLDNTEFLKKRTEKPARKKVETGSLYTRIQKAELKKKEVDTRIALIKEEKMRGELIPTDVVKIAFAQYSKSILTEFDNSIDKILSRISKKKKFTAAEVAKLRSEIRGELNLAVSSAVADSKKNIKSIINEFSETRGRGEHK